MKNKYNLLTLAPFCYSIPSIGDTAKITLLVLIPQLIMLFITNSFSALVQILISIIATVCAEILFDIIKKRRFNVPSIVFFQGFLIGFFVPEQYNLFLLFLVVFCVFFLVNSAFGGLAQSWINFVVIVLIMLYVLGTDYFPNYLLKPEDLKSPNIVTSLVSSGVIPENRYDAFITNFLNTKVFKYLGISLPTGYISLFWDSGSVIPAFRFNLLTSFATIILLAYNYYNWFVPTVFLATYSVLVRVFGLLPYGDVLFQGDILLALGTTGIIIVAFFLLQWPGTIPLTNIGKFTYSVLAGVFAFFIIGLGTSPIGAMFVVLAANIVSPLIQYCEEKLYDLKLNISLKSKPMFSFIKH